MDLPRAEKMLGTDAHLLRHPAAIFRDIAGIVVGAETAIEAAVKAVGHPPLAREESMAQPGNGREQRRSERHGVSPPESGVSSANPASEARWGSETASTLNIDPMPPRPPLTHRFSAPEMSSETSWLAFPLRAPAAGPM